ncbi:hypothetical protein SOVF_214570 [Spinacia oleracea]|nr:hypothetical protein SOVF_214570 [Spinacia oleracea]
MPSIVNNSVPRSSPPPLTVSEATFRVNQRSRSCTTSDIVAQP